MIDLNQATLRAFGIQLAGAPVHEFGRHVSPLCLSLEHAEGIGWSEPRVLPVDTCAVPLASGASQYALSMFDGLKAYRVLRDRLYLFRPAFHAQRFEMGARRLAMPGVGAERFVRLCARAAALHRSILPRHGAESLYLRPILSATDSCLELGVARRHALRILVSPCSRPSTRPLRLWIERETFRAPPGGLGAVQSGASHAAGAAALHRARSRGFDQVLFLDALWRHRITEAGNANVFVVRDGVVLTPPLDDTLLDGAIRDTCIRLLRARGQAVEEYSPTLSELSAWSAAGRLQEVFCTGTGSGVVSVSSLEGEGIRILPRGSEMADALRVEFNAMIEGRAACPDGWLVPVDEVDTADAGRGEPRTSEEARALAESWADACSRRDLEPVLGWFDERVVFVSPRAAPINGTARVQGRLQVRDYWSQAMARIGSISIEVEDVVFDPSARRMVIGYRGRFDARRIRATEHMVFGENGKIVASAGYHGAAF